MSLSILVDYDNLDQMYVHRGLVWLAERTLEVIASAGGKLTADANFRLYGGWFDGTKLSRRAQDLSAKVQRDFPRSVGLASQTDPVLVKAELSYSLAAMPSHVLFRTYRVRGAAPENLDFRVWPPTDCSSATNCALTITAKLLQSKQCPHTGCVARLQDVLSRPEQKLVDTMLVADLIHFAGSAANKDIGVVTSDDDVIPGICAAASVGARVIQVHTRSGRQTDSSYVSPLGKRFIQTAL